MTLAGSERVVESMAEVVISKSVSVNAGSEVVSPAEGVVPRVWG